MATYKVRGIAHNIIYPYRTEDGKVKHQWETYSTELEAMHRKAYIDYLQKNRLHHEIRKAAAEYQCKRAVEREVVERVRPRKHLLTLRRTIPQRPIESLRRSGCPSTRERSAFLPTPTTAIAAIWTGTFYRTLVIR